MFALDPCPAPCLLTHRCLFPKLAMSWVARTGLLCAEIAFVANFVN